MSILWWWWWQQRWLGGFNDRDYCWVRRSRRRVSPTNTLLILPLFFFHALLIIKTFPNIQCSNHDWGHGFSFRRTRGWEFSLQGKSWSVGLTIERRKWRTNSGEYKNKNFFQQKSTRKSFSFELQNDIVWSNMFYMKM